MPKLYWWTLKDKTKNAYKEKELLTFVGQIVPENGQWVIYGRHNDYISTWPTSTEAQNALTRHFNQSPKSLSEK